MLHRKKRKGICEVILIGLEYPKMGQLQPFILWPWWVLFPGQTPLPCQPATITLSPAQKEEISSETGVIATFSQILII